MAVDRSQAKQVSGSQQGPTWPPALLSEALDHTSLVGRLWLGRAIATERERGEEGEKEKERDRQRRESCLSSRERLLRERTREKEIQSERETESDMFVLQ